MNTTNYFDTLIEVAEDCPLSRAAVPVSKRESKTLAEMQFELIAQKPYTYTSDDVVFYCYVEKNEIAEGEQLEARQQFFSKGQPCLRTSPLAKRYGWGIHSNAEGKIAIYGVDSEEYEALLNNPAVKKVKAIRSKRA